MIVVLCGGFFKVARWTEAFMLNLYDVIFIVGYGLALVVALSLIVRKARPYKDLEPEFDGSYFLRWSLGWAAVGQAGLVVLLCALFWNRQSLAVGFTTLLGLPGFFVASAAMQWGFYRRYNRIENIIRRLENSGPAARQALLEGLPERILMQLPGDYRIISWEENKR
jgi:hypothetical protein